MATAATYCLAILAATLLLPTGVLFVQCIAAVIPARPRRSDHSSPRPVLGILVPAHNESAVIGATLDSIRPQLAAADRLLVIADNCTDDTADIARARGADVLSRHDLEHRGKGHALTAGLAEFAANPPRVVIVIDADCTLAPGCLAELARESDALQRPVQGCYLMPPPPNPRPNDVISSLAVLVKNKVRPQGMARLGVPCLLTGSGAAFPWKTLCSTSFAGSHIVEDMQLAVDLTLAGSAPQFCPQAELSAPLPSEKSAFLSQRTRWEHGHLHTLFTQAPRLLVGFLRSGRLDPLAMMLDLCVPPLSLLTMLWGGLFVAGVLLGLSTGLWIAAAVSLATGGLLAGAVGVSWLCFGRSQIPFSTLMGVPWYILSKLPVYAGFLYRRQTAWIRTRRSSQS